MREHKGRDEFNLTNSPTVAESLRTIHGFLDSFDEQDLNARCWELILYAFGSEDADGWSHLERSNMLYLYERLTAVFKALTVIDKDLRPLFVNA